MIVVLMGPMGCGKTTLGMLLAENLGWNFYDGDDYHPPANKKKMGAGIPLDDNDREPWLKTLAQLINEHKELERNMILACSALKKTYRQLLGIDQKTVVSVYLKGSKDVLKSHLAGRSHEYMDDDLLLSQLRTLEEPTSGIIVDVSGTPKETARDIIKKIDDYSNTVLQEERDPNQ